MLIVAPSVIDMAGNAANLYDTVSWWDDVNHFVNWAILWELLEYVTFIRRSPELKTAYTDTLGDLSLGLSGSVVAAAAIAYFRRESAAPTASSAMPSRRGQ